MIDVIYGFEIRERDRLRKKKRMNGEKRKAREGDSKFGYIIYFYCTTFIEEKTGCFMMFKVSQFL